MLNKKWPHGGDWKSFEDAAGRPPLDFSANISPLGVPDKVQQAIQEAAGQADTYPDPFCRELTRAFSKAHAVPKEQILFGNGAADLIYRIVLALRPKHALLPVPCFSEYRSALALAGCSISTLLLKEENDFHLPEDFPEMIPEETDIIFLCEPGNPAGVVNPLPLLLRTAEKCRQLGTVLVVDECFLDFLPDADSRSLLPYLDHFTQPDHPRRLHKAVRYGRCPSGLVSVRRSADPGPAAAGRTALERLVPGPGCRPGRPGMRRLCGPPAGPDRAGTVEVNKCPAGAGAEGHSRPGQLSAL